MGRIESPVVWVARAKRSLRRACTTVGLAATACTGGAGDRNVPDAGGRTYARLAITLTVAREGPLTIGASGRLLRFRGVDAETAQVLAGSPSAASDVSGPPQGRCAVIDDESVLDDALATSPPDAAVQMLDAGELLVHVAGQTVKLAPRYVPDIVPFVSGVVYDAELSALEPFAEAPEEAYLAAFGGQQVGRFLAPAEVPPAPRLLSVEGDRDADLAITWTPDPSARGPLEIVLAGDLGPSARCRVPDTGSFVIPAAVTARVAEAVRDEPLALALERTRRTPFSAPGIETADVEVTVRDVVSVR
jgi:hypothetical protein